MNTDECKFKRTCKKYKTEECNNMCYPFVFLHGTDGEGGLWKTRRTPKRYDNAFIEVLPINGESFRNRIESYVSNVYDLVRNKGIGLYLWGTTGNGKTTTAITIQNEYVLARSKAHLGGQDPLKVNPTLFIRISDFQNVYNAQFRGTKDMQEVASQKYYALKERMKETELLIVDDIAMRDMTEAFTQEVYEIIDSRATEEVATIFTSNVALTDLEEYLGERIASRIEGMTIPFKFVGKDNRKGGLF